LIVADGMAALRQGIRNRFRKQFNEGSRSSLRGRLSSRTGAHPGLWRRLEPTTLEDVSSDALDQEDLNRDRLRVLLDRYGILFRELLMRELPHMRWKQLFRSLRLMEFSGEVFGGYYFEDIPGLQYISARAFRILRGGLKADSIYWMNACDPIFPGGLPGLRFSGPVPRRIATNHVVYHGSQIVLVSHRHGRRLVFSDGIEPGHKNISIYLRLFHRLLERDFAPPQRIQVESINDVPALQSEYEADLLAAGFERDYRYLTLRRGGSGT
ncbi:MAG: hypothetical protein KDK30_13050, partial [Leptospiraceae bacterium]|nr:hypothetical protein [Leptospiraceae bacterium]